MYCSHCGKELSDDAVLCPECGTPTANMSSYRDTAETPQTPAPKTEPKRVDMNTCALIGFILSFLNAAIGLVVSIFGLIHAKRYYNGKGRGFSIAGIAIGASLLFINMIVDAVTGISLFFF